MGNHWKGRTNGRGLWPKNAPDADLPDLFADSDLGPRRREWLASYYIRSGECLEWKGGRAPFGYGTVNIGGRSRQAHRVAYACHYGVDPAGLEVCHSCDQPWCGEKTHLFLGTRSVNERDKVAKGRHRPPRGSANRLSKLDENKVREMREMYKQGWGGYRKIADHFGVSRTGAKMAITRVTWQHVE